MTLSFNKLSSSYLIVLLVLTTLLSACSSNPQSTNRRTTIGTIIDSIGYPTVVRNHQTYILAREATIYEGDILQTDKISKIKIRMIDGTTFTLGPASYFVIHQYLFMPENNFSNAKMSLTSGSLRTRTASITRLRRANFKLRTKLATITVRSSDFWSGYLFGQNTLDVAVIEGTGIYVKNHSGSTDIKRKGYGTTVIGNSAPHPAIAWTQAKLDEALSDTHF